VCGCLVQPSSQKEPESLRALLLGTMSLHSVQIQPGWQPGSQQVITVPATGQRMAIVVPQGVRAGQTITVQAPPAPAQNTLRVVVPAGCGPGSRVEFQLPDGRKMVATVPPGSTHTHTHTHTHPRDPSHTTADPGPSPWQG
jgi:hypothetical protein